MFADIVPLTRCIACSSCLVAQEQGLACSGCGRKFPEVRSVLRFVPKHSYADSFGYQWHAFDRTQLNPPASEWDFIRKTGLRPEELRGKLVLDVGCGMGRFAEVATRWGARVIGIDLSVAAEVAARNLADREFIALQADVFALPFASESFDVIYSVGVLHHTPDCEKAFKVLPQYLKPGGKIAVWLYSGYNHWYRFSDQYRKVTHRMSIRTLHRILSVAVPTLHGLDRGLRLIPIVGKPMAGALGVLFPISRNKDPEVRLLDTLDWYSPKYQSKHTYEEVFRWFEACALEHLTVADISIGVKGSKGLQSRGSSPPQSKTSYSAEPVSDLRVADSNKPAPKARQIVHRVSTTLRWLPGYAMQRLTRSVPNGNVHLLIALADHFEPAIVPGKGGAYASYDEQESRVDDWCREYPQLVDPFRDSDGHPFKHTYFYPAEQYHSGLIEQLAEHCHAGRGEIEIHLHHGVKNPDTEENTRRQLEGFRDVLALKHRSLSFMADDHVLPRYAFVHGNYALANSAGGRFCGVDSELQVLTETGCYADLTLPPGPFHPAQISKINSLYECELPLNRQAAHRRGRDLECGRPPKTFPIIIEGPMMLDFAPEGRARLLGIENAGITASYPLSVARLKMWKRARICVQGRPEWLFIKLHCHGMDPREKQAVLGEPMQRFLRELVEGAEERKEILHFVTAREMTNIILAACDGRDGNPGHYRDYRLKQNDGSFGKNHEQVPQLALKD
jgi:SAM-dependent methyltransferase